MYSEPVVAHQQLIGHAKYILFPPEVADPPPYEDRILSDSVTVRLRFAGLPYYASKPRRVIPILTWTLGIITGADGLLLKDATVNHDCPFSGSADISVVRPGEQSILNSPYICLFDEEGIWIAQTPASISVIQTYCSHLRSLPYIVAKRKLRGLPHSPLSIHAAAPPPQSLEPTLFSMVHAKLAANSAFYPYPPHGHGLLSSLRTLLQEDSTDIRTFWGQLPRIRIQSNLACQDLIYWLLNTIASPKNYIGLVFVCPHTKYNNQKQGSCVAGILARPEDWEAAKKVLNSRVVFDRLGAWVARNEEEEAIFARYIEEYRKSDDKETNLPSSTLVCENKIRHTRQQNYQPLEES